jgi:hypothetical protein
MAAGWSSSFAQALSRGCFARLPAQCPFCAEGLAQSALPDIPGLANLFRKTIARPFARPAPDYCVDQGTGNYLCTYPQKSVTNGLFSLEVYGRNIWDERQLQVVNSQRARGDISPRAPFGVPARFL